MVMPGRSFAATNEYRYGFNGQEKSKEINGLDNLYTAEFWQYDSRLGRRWNLDPKPTIGISDYSAMGNDPVSNIDPNGDYFFGAFGSTSEQRKGARAFAKEVGGKVNDIKSKKISVSYSYGSSMENTGVGKTGFHKDGFAKVFGREAHSDFISQSFNQRNGGKYDENTGRYGLPGPISGRVEMVDDPITLFGPGLIRGLIGKLTVFAFEKVVEKGAIEVIEEVAEKQLPKLLANSITVTEKGLGHTIERHTINGINKWMDKSKFLVSSEDAVKNLIQQAAQLPAVKQATGKNFQRIVNAGSEIGIDNVTKKVTNIYTVITDASNNLITAFPGVPGR